MGSADVEFQHNKYKPCRLANESFLDVLNFKKITFLKESFIVSSESSEKLFYTPRFGFQIESKKDDSEYKMVKRNM